MKKIIFFSFTVIEYITTKKIIFFSDTIGHDDGDYNKVDVMYTVEMEICLTMTNLFVVK